MGRGKLVAVLVVASLIASVAFVLLVVRPSPAPDAKSDQAAPDIEEVFAAKRSSAQTPGKAAGPSTPSTPSTPSSQGAAAQAERELAGATSALDQAHARLAAKRIDVSRAELAFVQAERKIEVITARSERPRGQRKNDPERLAVETEVRERVRLMHEQALRAEATEELNLRGAEERLKVAERKLESASSSR